MNVTCNVLLGEGETLGMSAEEGAQKLMRSLGADPETSHVSFHIQQSNVGHAGRPIGVDPAPAPPIGDLPPDA